MAQTRGAGVDFEPVHVDGGGESRECCKEWEVPGDDRSGARIGGRRV